ncbi:hypothetical protein WJX75_007990 [Coccomyxa subellipsoidea]|uniref:Coenzyme Q-binding protein COQ10 START domain-containing protein n=1 Tax=Coccomyxa subellipsoidea TaxID=248742 RepID=A0ABR2YN99_9CHLO
MKVALQAKVDLPPEEVYEILTAPDNAAVFKGIKKVPYRKVLEDDGRGKQKVEVEQLAAWKLLMFSGSFSTRLYVFQDKRRGIVKFRLARPGLMKDFAGMWRVQPYTSDAIGALSGSGQADAQSSNPWHSLTSTLNSYMGDRKAKSTLVTLEQSLEPAVRPPKPLEGLVKGIAVAQLQGLLTDLRLEVPRMKAGRPSCASLQQQQQQQQRSGNSQDSNGSQQGKRASPSAAGEKADEGDPRRHQWPADSWWGAIAGTKKQRKQVMWLETDLQDRHNLSPRGGSVRGVNRRC